MRIFTIGFIAFIAWTTFSTYFYVCKIKGLCYEPEAMQMNASDKKVAAVKGGLKIPDEPAMAPEPKNMVIYFAFDKSEFNADSGIDNYFEKSNAFLNQNTQARLNITGYTDAIGSEKYNIGLGYRRAQSLQIYFERKGIQANKIRVISKGETEPENNNNSISGRANNRRATITINN